MKDVIKRILVSNIKNCRERLNLTQKKASEKAGIALQYWQRLEMRSQKDLPSLLVLFKIAKVLQTSASRLLQKSSVPNYSVGKS